MDFSQLKGKTISILSNQASVNRNGRHLLSLLTEVEDVHVLAIFLPQYGLFASEDPKLKLMGNKSIDPIFGARPLRRVIQDEIEDMLSEDLLSGDLQPGDSVLIDVEDNKFVSTRNKIIDSEIVPEATSSAV